MAPHRRAALWTIASNTGWASAGDRRIMLSTSLVAVCCSSASSRSRASRAIFALSPATDELRLCVTFRAMRLLRAAAFGACALGDLPPALDRRRIAAPRLRTRHRGVVRLARWSMVRHNLSGADVGLKARNVSKTEQMLLVCPP